LLNDFNEDDSSAREVFDALSDSIESLKRQRREK
jgi:hypothetical protein